MASQPCDSSAPRAEMTLYPSSQVATYSACNLYGWSSQVPGSARPAAHGELKKCVAHNAGASWINAFWNVEAEVLWSIDRYKNTLSLNSLPTFARD